MWQRVQTLYLFVSTMLVGAMFFCEKAEGIRFVSYTPYLILLTVITLLNLLALTTWKIRVFQFRTAVFSSLITVALQAWLVFDFVVTGNDPVFKVPAVFPAVSIILNILAARNIWADEMMVRCSSRLRPAKKKQ